MMRIAILVNRNGGPCSAADGTAENGAVTTADLLPDYRAGGATQGAANGGFRGGVLSHNEAAAKQERDRRNRHTNAMLHGGSLLFEKSLAVAAIRLHRQGIYANSVTDQWS
jgi:hypothetical protein